MKSKSLRRHEHPQHVRWRRVGYIVVSTATAVLASVTILTHPSAALVSPSPSALHHAHCRTSFPLEHLSTSSLTRSKPTRSNKNQPVCFYADEWIDADIELAFHVGTSSAARSPDPTSSRFRRLFSRLSRTLYRLKENIRMRIERCTVYVLECKGGKYYVGSTTNRKRRFREHLLRKGSKWTRVHKPQRVLREYRRVPSKFLLGMESKVTAECMLEFGVNNVRGSMFCSPREYHMGDIDALTKFLGHYNALDYRKVNVRLSQTLPVSRKKQRKRNSYNRHMFGKCYSCGKSGHFAASCPEKSAVTLRP